jgi:hypothetical protein
VAAHLVEAWKTASVSRARRATVAPVAASTHVWDSLRDDTKAYLTLAASLLALSAAFADQLVKGDAIGPWALIAAWAVLAGALFSGFQAQASGFGGASRTRPGR